MCARLEVDPRTGRKKWVNAYDVDMPEEFKPKYSVYPDNQIPIIRLNPQSGVRESLVVNYGLYPRWTDDKKVVRKWHTYNARGETVGELKSFGKPFVDQRCIIPADAFYESVEDNAGKKQWYKFTLADGRLFSFAGI